MRQHWFHFLTNLPVRDPLARRQTPLLLIVLGCLFALSLLRLLFFFAVDQATIGAIPTIAVDTISLVAPAVAVLLLLRGHFAAAALLAALAMLLTLVIATIANGLRDSGMLPLVFALPIVFTGLLLDWRGLALVVGMSCAVVIGIAVLESQGSPWVGFAPSPELPASMASIFVFVTGLLVVLLNRFRQDYRRELAEHLRVAATLRQSEARFATAFRASPAALAMIRLRDDVFLDVNATFARLLGYDRDELIGQRGDALALFPGPTQSANIVTLLRDDGTVRDQEVQLRTKGGALREVLISLEALDLDGEPCVLGMAVDITDRKRAEHDLQQTTLDLQALVNDHVQLLAREQHARRVAEALHTTGQLLARPLDLDSILETLLDVLQQLIPYDSANIMLPDGASGFRVRHWRGYERWTDPALLTTLVFDPTQKPLIHAIVTTQRSVLVLDTHQEPSWTPMLGPDHIHCWLGVPLIAGNTVVGIYSIDRQRPNSITEADVRLAETLAATAATAIERAQLFAQVQDERGLLARRVAERTADLSLANAELARAARLKDEFLATMSHELRTPLNSILGRAEALQEAIYGPVTPQQVGALHGITESGQHLLALINDILDLSKIESGRLSLECNTLKVDLLGTMALRMVAQLALVKQIALTSSFDGQVQRLVADERRLKQILVNLLANAVKFTPEGGQVGLEVRGNPEQQTMSFTVWDTGIGIAAEDMPRLFQPFVQLDSRL
ncbi:MAG: GAF domain-containing protein, partial [Chloroflexales bacterium]|nr:GAF domain-containing protein [Chloroflexales bacterium]